VPSAEHQKSRPCQCDRIPGYEAREYQLPEGAKATFELYHTLDGTWERIYRCSVCGAFWHQSVTGGHATIDIYSRIDARDAARVIAKEQQDGPIRAATSEQRVTDAMTELESSAAAENASRRSPWRHVLIGVFGGAVSALVAASINARTPRRRRLMLGTAVSLVLLGLAVLAVLWQQFR
jgi:transcription elongation factor Elf1